MRFCRSVFLLIVLLHVSACSHAKRDAERDAAGDAMDSSRGAYNSCMDAYGPKNIKSIESAETISIAAHSACVPYFNGYASNFRTWSSLRYGGIRGDHGSGRGKSEEETQIENTRKGAQARVIQFVVEARGASPSK
jgi:hypothetical protein